MGREARQTLLECQIYTSTRLRTCWCRQMVMSSNVTMDEMNLIWKVTYTKINNQDLWIRWCVTGVRPALQFRNSVLLSSLYNIFYIDLILSREWDTRLLQTFVSAFVCGAVFDKTSAVAIAMSNNNTLMHTHKYICANKMSSYSSWYCLITLLSYYGTRMRRSNGLLLLHLFFICIHPFVSHLSCTNEIILTAMPFNLKFSSNTCTKNEYNAISSALQICRHFKWSRYHTWATGYNLTYNTSDSHRQNFKYLYKMQWTVLRCVCGSIR